MTASWIDGVFLLYIFLGLYLTGLFVFLLLPSRKKLYAFPQGKTKPVSIIVPCYNEEKTIAKTLDALLHLDYPRTMLEIVVVDDRSTDDSRAIVQRYAKKYNDVRLIVMPYNSGGAAKPINTGIRAARHAIVAVVDADSLPHPAALRRMIGFLQQEKVAGVTCAILAQERNNFLQRMQAVEYLLIAFNRKLLDLIDAVYVTPGPFALYRKQALIDVGLFDAKNMTQDIEIVWRLLSKGYQVKMCLAAEVVSTTPSRWKAWWQQRLRWTIGGIQCVIKYRSFFFTRSMLGLFIVPFFLFSFVFGILGAGLFCYLLLKNLLIYALSTTYTLRAGASVLHWNDFFLSFSFIHLLSMFVLLIGLSLSIYSISFLKRRENLFNMLLYHLVYTSINLPLLVAGLYRFARKKYQW